MERLTYKDDLGKILQKQEIFDAFGTDSISRATGCIAILTHKLYEYEELEITPDQVREMSQLYQEKCEEVARLEKRIEELDYIEYGCTSCMFDDERTEYEYPCNECNRLKEDMYSRKVEE